MRSFHRDALMMAVVLIATSAGAAVIGAVGMVNFVNGNTLRAACTLVVPAFLLYWAWEVRDNLGAEPMIPIYAGAWLAGLPAGLIFRALHHAFA